MKNRRKAISFNSKVVRLKENISNKPPKFNRCFNSKVVRLKEFTEPKMDTVKLSFNSKVVRLKEASPAS